MILRARVHSIAIPRTEGRPSIARNPNRTTLRYAAQLVEQAAPAVTGSPELSSALHRTWGPRTPALRMLRRCFEPTREEASIGRNRAGLFCGYR